MNNIQWTFELRLVRDHSAPALRTQAAVRFGLLAAAHGPLIFHAGM